MLGLPEGLGDVVAWIDFRIVLTSSLSLATYSLKTSSFSSYSFRYVESEDADSCPDTADMVDRPLEFLAGIHLYLHPSRGEGLCIGMHEAMQAGLPVIASKVGQMPYTLEDGRSGWLVPPGDVNALADALADALSDPARLASMGQAARARVLSHYSRTAFREAGEAVLNRLRARGVIGSDL